MTVKEINLLPKQYKKELKLRRLSAQAALFSCIILLASSVLFYILRERNRQLMSINAEYTTLLNSERYRAADSLYEGILGLRKEISSLNSMLEKINDPKLITCENIENIFKLLPIGVSAQTMTLTASESAVAFVGIADSREKVSKFAKALSDSGRYEDVVLKHLTTNDGVLNFILVFNIKNESEVSTGNE